MIFSLSLAWNDILNTIYRNWLIIVFDGAEFLLVIFFYDLKGFLGLLQFFFFGVELYHQETDFLFPLESVLSWFPEDKLEIILIT